MTQKSVPRLVQCKLPCKFLTPSLRDPSRSVHKPQRCDDVLAVNWRQCTVYERSDSGSLHKTWLLHAYTYDHDMWQCLPHCFAAQWTIRVTSNLAFPLHTHRNQFLTTTAKEACRLRALSSYVTPCTLITERGKRPASSHSRPSSDMQMNNANICTSPARTANAQLFVRGLFRDGT